MRLPFANERCLQLRNDCDAQRKQGAVKVVQKRGCVAWRVRSDAASNPRITFVTSFPWAWRRECQRRRWHSHQR